MLREEVVVDRDRGREDGHALIQLEWARHRLHGAKKSERRVRRTSPLTAQTVGCVPAACASSLTSWLPAPVGMSATASVGGGGAWGGACDPGAFASCERAATVAACVHVCTDGVMQKRASALHEVSTCIKSASSQWLVASDTTAKS